MLLGEILVRNRAATSAQIDEALRKKEGKERIGQALIRLGFVKEDDVLKALSEQTRIPYVDIAGIEIDPALSTPSSMKTIFQRKVLPLDRSNGTMRVALSDPLDLEVLDDLRYVFRHLPLADVHDHAEVAAQAAEVAGTQGRFWEMHDLLFRHQDELEWADLVGYAGDLGLDVEQFVRDLSEGRCAERVREETLALPWQVVHDPRRGRVNGLRVEDDEIGVPADLDPPAFRQPEQPGRLVRDQLNGAFEGHELAAAKGVAQEAGRIRRTEHPVDVCAGVRPAEEDVLLFPDLPARLPVLRGVGIGQRP